MASNANSVNIENAKASYHHGDLRAALIGEGLRLLETDTADALSLREVARNVGVSAPAVYRHFPDKAAFLQALALEGLKRLAREQKAASAKGGAQAFAASGRAYVRFALANPGLFRLIFTSGQGHTELAHDPEGSAGWLLSQHVAAQIGANAPEEHHKIKAYRAWALVHGLALLILDRQIDREEGLRLIDPIVSADSI